MFTILFFSLTIIAISMVLLCLVYFFKKEDKTKNKKCSSKCDCNSKNCQFLF